MKENNKNQRRDFLKKSGMALGTFTLLPSSVLFSKPELRSTTGELLRKGNVAPSDKVNMAFCGIGNRAGSILKEFMNTGMVNNVAMCDTDMGAEHTLENMNAYPKVARYQDFRKMFDEMSEKIDAVCVGTPDFSHFPICMLAMSLGIHVYV